MRSTNERSFFDTNVLVYTDDASASAKLEVAIDLLEQAILTSTGVVSTQVLQEYFVTATRKLAVSPEDVSRKVELIGSLDVVTLDVQTIISAIDLHRLRQLSFWDALIVQAALRGRCTRLFTEDLQHGQRILGLEVVNPFL